MVNSVIINNGKAEILDHYQHDADAIDIFSMRSIKPKGYIRHKLTLSARGDRDCLSFFHSEVYDNGYDHFLGDMCLTFKTENIVGAGTVSFCDYFGYAAIASMVIKVTNAEYKFDGDYLFNQILELPEDKRNLIFASAGHNDQCRKANTSEGVYETVKGSQDIAVVLRLPFGLNWPKNLIPLATNDVLNVSFNIRPIQALLNYNDAFIPKFRDSYIQDPQLTIEIFSKKSTTRPLYEPRIDIPLKQFVSDNEVVIPACKYFSIQQQCHANDCLFPIMIDNWKTEEEVVEHLYKYLIKNILYIVPNDKKNEFKNNFPPTANFAEVVNGEVIIRKDDTFQQKRKVNVSVIGVPPTHTLLYHTNLLVINKYRTRDGIVSIPNPWFNDLNLSEKFLSIKCYYDNISKSIIPLECKHVLQSQYASIPVESFKQLGEDNRRLDATNYHISSHFTQGPNMFKPMTNIQYTVYSNDSDNDQIITTGDNSSIMDILKTSTAYSNTVEIFEPQNTSKFYFGNIDNMSYKIVFKPSKFFALKDELTNMYLEGKELKDLRHREGGFENLYPVVNYMITYYTSKQISQSVSNNNKHTSYLIQ